MADNISKYNKSLTPEESSERGRQAGIASGQARAARATYYDIATENITPADIEAQIETLKKMALKGNIRAIELLLKILREYETKVNIDSNTIYEIVVSLDDDESAY